MALAGNEREGAPLWQKSTAERPSFDSLLACGAECRQASNGPVLENTI